MEDKVIDTIMYIKSVSKKKPSADRIKTHLLKIGNENVWSIGCLPNLLKDMCDKGLIELTDSSDKIKQRKERKLVEETLAELTSLWVRDFSFSRNPKIPRIIVFTKKLKHPRTSICSTTNF